MRLPNSLPALLLALGALALGPALVVPARAQSAGWSTPTEVSQLALPPGTNAAPDERRYGSSWFAALASGPDGGASITWYSGISLGGEASNSLDLLMYRELRDGRWSSINEVAAPATGGFTVRNSLSLGRDGRLHALFRGETRLYSMSAPWDEAIDARAWTAPVLIADGSTYYNDLAAAPDGSLHAFWSEAVPDDPLAPNKICPSCSDLFYRSSTDGGLNWSPEINLSQSPEGENRPQARVDAQNRIHIVWDEGVDWYAGAGIARAGVYRRSDDGGQTWSEPVRFALPAADAEAIERARAAERGESAEAPTPAPDQPREYLDAVQQTALALDSAGNPAVVFRGALNNQLYLQRSSDGGDTWGPPEAIPGLLARSLGDNNLDTYALAYDGADTLHLLMVGFDASTFNPFEPTNPTLLSLSYADGRWSAPEAVVRNELYPEYPRLEVSGGNKLQAVWFTRSPEDLFTSDRARYRVWYSERNLQAPAVAPEPFFTPVPTAAATATPAAATATPAPTPLSAAALEAPPIAGRPNWERSSISMIGLAMLPAIVIIGVIAALRAFLVRRR